MHIRTEKCLFVGSICLINIHMRVCEYSFIKLILWEENESAAMTNGLSGLIGAKLPSKR